MTWHLAQVSRQGGGQGLFCRDLRGVKVVGSEGAPAAQWHQVSSRQAHALLGTGSGRHSGPWQALPGDSGPAPACLPGLSPLAQPALGQSVHKWVLGRLCQAAGGGESRERQTQLGEKTGLSWGLPPSFFMNFSEADLIPGSGGRPWGQKIQILDSTIWVQFLAAPRVTLGIFTPSVLQFPHMQNEHNSNAYPIGWLEGLNY